MNNFTHETSKLIKGLKYLISFGLIASLTSFFVQSCQREQYENSNTGKAAENFISSMKENKNNIGKIVFGNLGSNISRLADTEPIYLEFNGDVSPQVHDMYNQTNSLEDLSNLIDNTDAIIQYEPTDTNSNYQLNVSIDAVTNSLNPLILQAKNYLYTKGFTAQTIQNMLVEQNGKEEDLIPFVMSLTHIENGGQFAQNLYIPFVNFAYAKLDANDYIRCAGVAIGADILWSLGSSSAASWTIGAMTRAFGAVAKRFLGPIGVAIAVVSFGVCIHEAYYD